MHRDQRGAQAVEFALVLPLLVLLLVGIMEFGLVFNKQSMITQAARAAARSMALGNSPTAAREAARQSAPQLSLSDGQIAVSPTSCPPAGDTDAVVTITYATPLATGLFGATITLTGRGVMRCGG